VDTKEYISSGILESYLLGTVSAQEKKEVECLSHIYPEIKKELDKLSLVFENYIGSEVIEAPERLKNKILSQLPFDSNSVNAGIIEEKTEAKVIRLNGAVSQNKKYYALWGAAAAVMLFLSFSIVLYLQGDKKNKQMAALQGELDTANDILDDYGSKQSRLENQMALITNPENAFVKLKGTEKHPEASVSVSWDKKTNDVFLAVNTLPSHSAEHQYQLWAIVAGKPVSMGMLEMNPEKSGFVKMGNIQNAQAFAITLETKGGNPTPNLEQLVVIGNA
jgi:hypothetical protein